MAQPLLVILVSLTLAYILAELFRKIGMPRVVGQVGAGLLLGASTYKNSLFTTETLDVLSFLANLGIILMFYYVGLETNIKSFMNHIKKSLLISLFNTSIPFIFGFIAMRYFFSYDTVPSLIIGVSLSVSAQSASVDILEELKLLKTKLGSMIISAGAVDDIAELLMITSLLAIFHSSMSTLTINELMFDMFIFALIIAFARLIFVPYTLRFFVSERSSTSRFTVSMIIVLLIASLSELLGAGLFIGAIVAGIIVRQTIFNETTLGNWEQHDIAKSTHIISFGFLIPLFFVFIGLNTDLSLVLPNLKLILIFVAIATIGTVGGTILAVKIAGGTLREGLLLGWGLNPKGDIELALITLALKFSIISQQVFTSLVVMTLITTIFSPIVFKYLALHHAKHKHELLRV